MLSNKKSNSKQANIKQATANKAKAPRRRQANRLDFASELNPGALQKYSSKGGMLAFDRLRTANISRDGFLWAIEHLDPGGSHVTSPGCPDLLTGNRHLHPQRLMFDVSAPSSNGTWDMVILTTPFVDMPLIISKYPSDMPITDIQFRDVHRPLNDASASNQWWWFPEYLDDGAYPTKTATHTRLLSRSITTTCIGPEVVRSGRVISGQVPVDGFHSTTTLNGITSACKTGTVAYRLPKIQGGSTYLLETDALAGERAATLGDYNVLRMSTPWGSPTLRPTLQIGDTAWCINDDTQVNDIDWAKSSHHHTWNDDFNWGVTFYEGLNPQEVVKVKVMGTAEMVPKQGSALATLTKVVPPADLAAITLVADITCQLPHSYPADYNDLGGIFGAIGHALKNIGVPLARTVGSLGLPIASPIASGLAQIASAFGW